MSTSHFELLVEEASMEAFLRALLPRLLPSDRTFEVHPFQGKQDLLRKLEPRLRAYSRWLPTNWLIVVVVDRDDDDCRTLKERMMQAAAAAGLRTKRRGAGRAQVVNRIAIEELEAWYFGNWTAVVSAYPRVPLTVPQRRGFRDPDAIAGGTWERFEQVLQSYGYFQTGLLKVDAARVLGSLVDPSSARSHSFATLCRSFIEAVS